MAKTLKNGLIMIETNPLNHNWPHFVILSGLTLHQFQKKKLLLSNLRKVSNDSITTFYKLKQTQLKRRASNNITHLTCNIVSKNQVSFV